MVYLLKIVIFHGYVSHNQMNKGWPRYGDSEDWSPLDLQG